MRKSSVIENNEYGLFYHAGIVVICVHTPPNAEKISFFRRHVDNVPNRITIRIQAEVAEQADALRSGRSGIYPMWVRLPPSAHSQPLIIR